MKRLMVMAGIGIAAAAAAQSNWYLTTVDDDRRVGKMCSLALDDEDNPHISYYDLYNRNLKYAYFDGASWRREVVDSEYNTGQYTGLALDSQGLPHISYSYYRDSDHAELRYAHFDGAVWRTSTVDREGGMHTAIALDAQDRPHIAYGEWISLNSSNLRYAYFDAGQWHTEIVDTGGRLGYCNSIALDAAGRAHISYRDDYPHCWLKYAYYDGRQWQVTTADTSLNATGRGTSIAVDSNGRPHISYQEDLSEALKYAYFDGSRWRITVVDDDNVSGNTSLVLDDGDRPHISYCADWGTGGPHYTSEFRYAKYDGAEWQKEVIERGGEDEGLGGWSSLVLDSYGDPHVAYEALFGSVGESSSLKYARSLGSYLNYFTAVPRGFDGLTLTWSVKAPLGEQIYGFNLYRREKDTGEWSPVNEGPLPGGSSGSYDDAGLACMRCYEYALEGTIEGGKRPLGFTEGTTTAPRAHVLFGPRPNPSSTSAVIAFELMDRADVDLTVYDLSGRKVATLAAGWLPPGAHEYECDVSALAPGVYVYRMTAGDWTGARKMVVVR